MKDNNDLVKDITEHLDQSTEALDPQILSQIRAARFNALEKKRSGFMQWAFPAGGVAVAAVALFIAVNLVTGPEKISTLPIDKIVEIQPDQIELVEILSSDQQLDFFENLEFYAWLAENEDTTG